MSTIRRNTLKPYSNAMTIGRFQGLHAGHVGLIRSMVGLSERSLIFIGSAQEERTERNPFKLSTRIFLLRSVFHQEISSGQLQLHALDDMTDESDICYEWGRYLIAETVRQTGKLPDLTVHGKEPAHQLWYCPEDDDKMATLAIPKSTFMDVSATDLRWYITNGDYRNFIRVAPEPIHEHFDALREELLKVDYYKRLLECRGVFSISEAGG